MNTAVQTNPHLETIQRINNIWAKVKRETSVAMMYQHKHELEAIDPAEMEQYEARAKALIESVMKDINGFIQHGRQPEPMDTSILEQINHDWDVDDTPMTGDLEPAEYERGEESITGFDSQSRYAQERVATKELRIILDCSDPQMPTLVEIEDAHGKPVTVGKWEKMDNGLTALVLTAEDFQQ